MGRYLRTDNTTKRIVRVVFKREVDTDPDLSYLGEYSNTPEAVHIDRQKRGDMGRGEYRYFNAGAGDPQYIREDYKRYEAYNAGDWHMTWLVCEAVVSINGIQQTVTSGGLSGVESDSDASYFDEIRAEQLGELKDVLKSMGFRVRDINAAFAKCEDGE